MNSLLKKPSAWIPLALSLAMLAFLLTYLALFGASAPDPNADEGTPAHLFQIWLAVEVLLVPFFALKWLPQAPKEALQVLAVQIAAALPSLAIVFFFT